MSSSKTILISLSLLYCTIGWGQHLLPVKQNYLVGYIDTSGQVVNAPAYEYLSNINLPFFDQSENQKSGYYLISTKGRLGLINKKNEIVLQPLWEEIQPLSYGLFVVRKNDLLNVTDSLNNFLLPVKEGGYEDIRIVDKVNYSFFIVQKDDLWGVHQQGQTNLTIPNNYTDIGYLDFNGGCFKVKTLEQDTFWDVINWKNKSFLRNLGKQREVFSAGEDHILTRESENLFWKIRDKKGQEKKRQFDARLKGKSFISLNRYILAFPTLNQKYGLSAYFFSKDTIHDGFDDIWPYDQTLAFFRANGQIGLLDSVGRRIMLDSVSEVMPGKESILRVKCLNGKWALYDMNKRAKITLCQYDNIDRFYGKLAKFEQQQFVGLLNGAGEEVVPARYYDLEILAEDGSKGYIVKAYAGDTLAWYRMDNQGKALLKAPEIYPNTTSLEVIATFQDEENTEPGYTKAGSTKKSRKASVNCLLEIIVDEQGLYQLEDSLFWQKNSPSEFKLVRKTTKNNGQTFRYVTADKHYPNEFPGVFRCKNTNWLAVIDETQIENELTKNLSFRGGVQKIQLFNLENNKFIPDLELIGIRLQDFEDGLPYAAFIRTDGSMGFIDRQAKEKRGRDGQPERFYYIGKSSEGLIRASAITYDSSSTNVLSKTTVDDPWSEFNFIGKSQKNAVSALPVNGSVRIASGKWGYLHENGTWAIPPLFDFAADFDQSTAINSKNGRWGSIDNTGKEIVPFKYDYVSHYGSHWRTFLKNTDVIYYDLSGRMCSDTNMAKYNDKDKWYPKKIGALYGYCNINDSILIAPQYDIAGVFTEGIAPVKKQNNWLLLDTLGHEIAISTDQKITRIFPSRNDRMMFRVGKKCGFTDRRGAVVVPATYDWADPAGFSNAGFITVGKIENRDTLRGILNKKGEVLVPFGSYKRIREFNQFGFAEVWGENASRKGVIDQKGSVVLETRFAKIFMGSDGFAVYDSSEVKPWKFYPLSGKEPSTLSFPGDVITGKNIFPPSEGTCLFLNAKTKTWQYHYLLSKNNEYPASSGYFEARPFEKGYAWVMVKNPNGYELLTRKQWRPIKPHKNETFVSWSEGFVKVQTPSGYYFSKPPSMKNNFHQFFEDAGDFDKYHVAKIKQKGKYGIINQLGMIVVAPKYTNLYLNNGYIETTPGNKIGFVSGDGSMVIEPAYDKLVLLNNQIILLEWGDKMGYIKLDGKWIWPLTK